MGAKAGDLTARLRLKLAGVACLFTNVRGVFWSLDGKRKIPAGLLAKGASDQIGFTPIKITKEMIGRTFAVFTALEVKAEGDTIKKHQSNFLKSVASYGGISGVVRAPEDGEKIIKKFLANRHDVP